MSCSETFYIAGVWDLFHIGHLCAIYKARQIAGDGRLIVGVVTDAHAEAYKGFRPIIPYYQRFEIISALKYADIVVPQCVQFSAEHMAELGVTTVLLGENWKQLMPPHLAKMMETVKVIFIPTTPGVSSSLIKEKIRKESQVQ